MFALALLCRFASQLYSLVPMPEQSCLIGPRKGGGLGRWLRATSFLWVTIRMGYSYAFQMLPWGYVLPHGFIGTNAQQLHKLSYCKTLGKQPTHTIIRKKTKLTKGMLEILHFSKHVPPMPTSHACRSQTPLL